MNRINSLKSVMMCSAPSLAAGISSPISAKRKHGSTSDGCVNRTTSRRNEDSFRCGTVAKPWGANVVIAEKSKVLSRLSTNHSALARHKKWLSEMQQLREKRIQESKEQTTLEEERKRDFMEKQAKRRAEFRQQRKEGDDRAMTVDISENDDREAVEERSHVYARGVTQRPVWALTESAAETKHVELQEREEEDLLDFADQLDFERYYEDMELGILLSQVKGRIRSLQREKNMDQSRLRAVIEVSSLLIKEMLFWVRFARKMIYHVNISLFSE